MNVLIDALPAIWSGAIITVQITVMVAPIALVLSIAAGLARASPWRLVRTVTSIYVETFRGTSALVQLFVWFYVLPLVGPRLPPLETAVFALSLNLAAYGSEVVRGAVASVDKGQREAATALGMSERQSLRSVILPQAFVAMIPPFGNLFVELLKNTSLVSLIALHELTSSTRQYLQLNPGDAVPVFVAVLLVYLALTRPIVYGMAALERRLAFGMRGA